MIDFEEELAKFKPCMNVDLVEETVLTRDMTDVTDLIMEILQEKQPAEKE